MRSMMPMMLFFSVFWTTLTRPIYAQPRSVELARRLAGNAQTPPGSVEAARIGTEMQRYKAARACFTAQIQQAKTAGADAYWSRKRLRDQYRLEQERGEYKTFHDVEKLAEHYEALRMLRDLKLEWHTERARRMAPKPLSSTEFDRQSGKISWPVLLWHERFDEERSRLDALFAIRQNVTTGSRDGLQCMLEIRDATRSAESILKTMADEVPPMHYASAKRFLESLAYVAQSEQKIK